MIFIYKAGAAIYPFPFFLIGKSFKELNYSSISTALTGAPSQLPYFIGNAHRT